MARELKKTDSKKTKSSTSKKAVKKKASPKPETRSTAKPSKAVKKTTPAKKAVKKNAAKKAAPAAKKPVKRRSARKAPTKQAATKHAAMKKSSPGKASKLNVEQVIKDFRTVVNLKRDQLERWLNMPDSRKLRFKDEAKVGTVGHESGKRILKILGKRRDKYTEDDLRYMQTVVGFVRQHRREKPPGDVFASNWRYSLMNWGHDPMK